MPICCNQLHKHRRIAPLPRRGGFDSLSFAWLILDFATMVLINSAGVFTTSVVMRQFPRNVVSRQFILRGNVEGMCRCTRIPHPLNDGQQAPSPWPWEACTRCIGTNSSHVTSRLSSAYEHGSMYKMYTFASFPHNGVQQEFQHGHGGMYKMSRRLRATTCTPLSRTMLFVHPPVLLQQSIRTCIYVYA